MILLVDNNDALEPDELVGLAPDLVVLSPGPGHPRDAGLCLSISDLLPETPILGVCLGHQALALGLGATVRRAPRPTHGRPHPVTRSGPKGTTAKPSSMATTIAVGANTNTARSANGGTQSCLVSNLSISAATCSAPKGPRRFGP